MFRDVTVKTPFSGKSNQLVLLAFLAVALWASFKLIQPYIEPIVLAFIVGSLALPVHEWLEKKLGGRANLAALASCLLLTLVIVVPLTLVLIAILTQGLSYSAEAKQWLDSGQLHEILKHPWLLAMRGKLEMVLPPESLQPAAIKEQLLNTATVMGSGLMNASTQVLGSVSSLLMNFTLMLFVLFFVLRDHQALVEFIRHALPLSRSQEDLLLKETVNVSKSALLGTLLTSMTQGVIGGIGMALAGYPGLFWGTMMAFASLIPVVGTALIWLPAALIAIATGNTGWGVFLIIWGVVVVGSIDNFVRPLFMQGSSSMNTVMLFFSLLGGLQLFGLMGLLYGPLVIALTLVMFRIYEREYADFLVTQDNS